MLARRLFHRHAKLLRRHHAVDQHTDIMKPSRRGRPSRSPGTQSCPQTSAPKAPRRGNASGKPTGRPPSGWPGSPAKASWKKAGRESATFQAHHRRTNRFGRRATHKKRRIRHANALRGDGLVVEPAPQCDPCPHPRRAGPGSATTGAGSPGSRAWRQSSQSLSGTGKGFGIHECSRLRRQVSGPFSSTP